jgi:hypothetical protein
MLRLAKHVPCCVLRLLTSDLLHCSLHCTTSHTAACDAIQQHKLRSAQPNANKYTQAQNRLQQAHITLQLNHYICTMQYTSAR